MLWSLLLLLCPSAHAGWAVARAPNTPDNVAVLSRLGAGIEGGDEQTILFDLPADALLDAQRLVPLDLLAADAQDLRPPPDDGRDLAYHDPESVAASLRALAATWPEIARVVDIGDSVEGRDLLAVLLTDRPWEREPDEPSLRVLGTHHGDEWSSMEVPLALAWRLAERYGDGDPEVVSLLDDNEVWILPVVNPDGVVAFERRNAHGVDINRNYSYQWLATASSGPRPFSEPESRAVRALSLHRSFHHSLTMHSGATSIGWPWNYAALTTPEDPFLAAACARYAADTAQPGFWISQGSLWYITHGDTNDWSYGVRGGQDYTVELTADKAPPAGEIEAFLGYHVEPSLRFLLDGAGAGVRGRTTDEDGVPVEARFLSPQAAWPGYSDPETGVFARPLAPGTYDLQFLAEGHQAVSRTVVVGEDGPAWIDVVLPRSADLAVERAEGLEGVVTGSWTGRICGDGLEEVARDGGVATLSRPGLNGPFPMMTWAEDGCAAFTLGAEAVPGPEVAEGEWSLALRDSAGSIRAWLPQGVLLASGAPGFLIEELALADDGEGVRIDVLGVALPEGADLRLVGPAGQRVRPERLPGDTPERLSMRVQPAGLDRGTWSLRVFGNGRDVALPGAIESTEDGLRTGPPPFVPREPGPRPNKGTPPPKPTPTPPEGEGCACSGAGGSRPALVALLLLATLLRRRSRP